MNVMIVKDYDEVSFEGADIVEYVVKNKPEAVLGLATGSSPIGMYAELAKRVKERRITFKDVKTVNLDEYVGLGAADDQSYVWFMNHNLFDNIDIDKRNTHLPNGKAENLQKECARYSELLKSFPQDLQVLGLGSNGHVGFNEPGTPFDSKTHIVNLTANTIKDNSRLFASIEEVPKRAITMGISEIIAAKKILVLVSGENKAKALRAMAKGEISEDCPASILQRHPDVTVIADKAAASLL